MYQQPSNQEKHRNQRLKILVSVVRFRPGPQQTNGLPVIDWKPFSFAEQYRKQTAFLRTSKKPVLFSDYLASAINIAARDSGVSRLIRPSFPLRYSVSKIIAAFSRSGSPPLPFSRQPRFLAMASITPTPSSPSAAKLKRAASCAG